MLCQLPAAWLQVLIDPQPAWELTLCSFAPVLVMQILWPLVRLDEPHCYGRQLCDELMVDWYRLVLQLKNELWVWANKHIKHAHVSVLPAESSAVLYW